MSTRPPSQHERVVQELLDRIGDGAYPPGSLLPPQRVLAEDFDASRDTIQRALRELADLGLVSSRQGSGTTVLARPPVAPPSRGVSPAEPSVTSPETSGPYRDGAPAQQGLDDALFDAFAVPDVSIDAVVGSAAPLLAALTTQARRVIEGEARPTSIRVRVLLLGVGEDSARGTADEATDGSGIEALRHLLENTLGRDHGDALLLQPEYRLEETREWFDSWWELFGR